MLYFMAIFSIPALRPCIPAARPCRRPASLYIRAAGMKIIRPITWLCNSCIPFSLWPYLWQALC